MVPGVPVVVHRPNAENSSRDPISSSPPGITTAGVGLASPSAAAAPIVGPSAIWNGGSGLIQYWRDIGQLLLGGSRAQTGSRGPRGRPASRHHSSSATHNAATTRANQ